MFKNLFLIAMLPLAATTANANDVYGVISSNTTWTKANSPYIIKDHLLLAEGTVLTIEPGVTVKGEKDANFYVEGDIIANGTVTDSIFFKSVDVNNGWKGMTFRPVSSRTKGTFKYCKFTGAYRAIAGYNTDLIISNSTFHKNDGVCGASGGSIEFRNNLVLANRSGVGATDSATGQISDNEIRYNDGIGTGAACFVTIKNNIIDHNGIGIYVPMTLNPVVDSIVNNIVTNNYRGVVIESKVNNLIGNYIGSNHIGADLIYANVNATNNTFRGNETGIKLNVVNSKTIFENNCFDTSHKYLIDVSDYNNYSFKNNWWGTSDTAIIRRKVIDGFKNFVNGYLFFSPILNVASSQCKVGPPPTGLQTMEDKAPRLSIYPNPFNSTINIASATQNITDVQLAAIDGRVTLMKCGINEKTYSANLTDLPAGIYLYKITMADRTVKTGKLVKQ